ncbi:hypothetical protein MD484_g8358, partial [Candolleomyces efflorescens]
MSRRKVEFPAQGFVQYDLIQTSTSRGVKARFSRSKKEPTSTNAAKIPNNTPLPPDKRSLKRHRTDSEPAIQDREKSSGSFSPNNPVEDEYPGLVSDPEDADDFNPEIFVPLEERTSEGKDRRRELARVWQQYNHLINLKRNGFAHINAGRKPTKGDFALFCPVCPQVGINIPNQWREKGPQYLYYRYLVGDGNFVCNHLGVRSRKGVDPELPLADGAMYMTESSLYQEHINSTKETTEGPTCYEHRAVSDKNKSKPGYDSTGLVAVACARHGCFAPGACVDMQKGERQMNMDYALCQACDSTNAEALPALLFAYDINCQYCVNFRKRISKGQYLTFPSSHPVHFLIGLFHVHGHREECLPRFAPTFFPGAGMTSGEILESLWSQLNGVANITRTMTLGHRSEMLDACIGDINWRKLQTMVTFLIRQRKRALAELASAEARFASYDESTTPSQRADWQLQLEKANEKRIQNPSDPSPMDILNPVTHTVESRLSVQIRLMRDEEDANSLVGTSGWLSNGIALQEQQLQAQNLVGHYHRAPTTARELEIEKKRETILHRLNEFYSRASSHFPSLNLDRLTTSFPDLHDTCACELACSCLAQEKVRPSDHQSAAEYAVVPLPSSLDTLPPGWNVLAKREEDLRVAQANEALEDLRSDIANKSYLYRANRSLAQGKRERTRGYDAINTVEGSMRMNGQRYRLAVWALKRLGVSEKYPHFRNLTRADTKAVTAIYEPNKPGLRTDDLSWIWKLEVTNGTDFTNDRLTEVHRLNWLRSLNIRDRWKEELTIVTSEMECRLRSIAMAWITLRSAMSDEDSDKFLEYFITEIGIGSYLTGYGVVVHGSMIRAPHALSALLRALTKDELSDSHSCLDVLLDRRDRSDDLLEFYVGNWWSSFGSNHGPSTKPLQSVEFTIDCWKSQRRNLVPFIDIETLNQVNLGDLNRKELEEAHSVASDSVHLLELEGDKLTRYLSEVTTTLSYLIALKTDLRAVQARYESERSKSADQ